MASGVRAEGAARRASHPSIRATAPWYSASSAAGDIPGATSTFAMIVARLNRLSSTSRVSATMSSASGSPRSSAGASGSRSRLRTTS
jgi:hypothetical protein